MSFVLPGNARSLRFSGEAKALAPNAEPAPGAMALGKPRLRKTPTPPPPAPMPAPRLPSQPPPRAPREPVREVRAHHPAAMAYAGSGGFGPPRVPPWAGPGTNDDSYDGDADPTLAMDRDGLDVMPGGRFARMPKPLPAAGRPAIPHFRPGPNVGLTPDPPAVAAFRIPLRISATAPTKVTPKTAGAPLLVWLVAALIAGVVTYYVAPAAVASVEARAHAAAR